MNVIFKSENKKNIILFGVCLPVWVNKNILDDKKLYI
jgi:hypothetical protein